MELRKAQEASQRQRDAMASEAEIRNVLAASLMNEPYADTLRHDNSNRHIPYNFKGFSLEQRQAILDEQARQITEKRAHVEREREEEREYDRQQEEIRKETVKLQRKVEARRVEERTELLGVQKQQAAEKDARYVLLCFSCGCVY